MATDWRISFGLKDDMFSFFLSVRLGPQRSAKPIPPQPHPRASFYLYESMVSSVPIGKRQQKKNKTKKKKQKIKTKKQASFRHQTHRLAQFTTTTINLHKELRQASFRPRRDACAGRYSNPQSRKTITPPRIHTHTRKSPYLQSWVVFENMLNVGTVARANGLEQLRSGVRGAVDSRGFAPLRHHVRLINTGVGRLGQAREWECFIFLPPLF